MFCRPITLHLHRSVTNQNYLSVYIVDTFLCNIYDTYIRVILYSKKIKKYIRVINHQKFPKNDQSS